MDFPIDSPPFLEDFPARYGGHPPQPSATGAVGAALRGLRPSHVRGVSGAPCGGIERDDSWGRRKTAISLDI